MIGPAVCFAPAETVSVGILMLTAPGFHLVCSFFSCGIGRKESRGSCQENHTEFTGWFLSRARLPASLLVSSFQIAGASVFFGQRTILVSHCFQISGSLSYHEVVQDGFMKVAIAITTMIILLTWLFSWPFVFGKLANERAACG